MDKQNQTVESLHTIIEVGHSAATNNGLKFTCHVRFIMLFMSCPRCLVL